MSNTAFPFRRSYKACLHCRERKVRCDLGSLEHPSDPPCARCKREGHKCEFVPSRRGGAKNVRAGKVEKLRFRSVSVSVSNDDDEDDDDVDDDNDDGEKKKLTGSLFKDRGLNTTADALNILAHVADTAEGKSDEGVVTGGRRTAKSRESRWTFKTAKLSSFVPVQKGLITEDEIAILVKFFFDTLHPFYPYIPRGLQSLANLAAHPMLLVTILSIASRYCSLPDPSFDPTTAKEGSSPRSKHVHYTIWVYGESLISQTVWAEASSISLATVLAFLVLSQWNPRSIHYRNGDYANPTDMPSNDEDGKGPEGGGGFGGFAAARRSDRMAWMMIGVAIRLAQDMNLFAKWREICIACYYADITLALRLGRPSMLSYSFQETPLVTFSSLDNAKLDILRILSFAHQSLYSSPGSMQKILDSDNYLPLLKYFRSKLTAWNSKYQALFANPGVQREALLFEFHYTELYIYSLALSPPGHRQVDESIAEVYVLYATQAAQQCIAVMQRTAELHSLQWAPIQWFVRAVHAAIFLAKVLALDRDPPEDRQTDLVATIRSLAMTMHESSPDELHLSNKYSAALMGLCTKIEPELNKRRAELALGAAGASSSVPPDEVVDTAVLADDGIFESGFGGTAIAELDSMKWFIDSYGIGFDGNYTDGVPENKGVANTGPGFAYAQLDVPESTFWP
ncbi:hypothetical protein V1512DRAFT_257763 [Lipomyces arxii]|uniref:uncharacterized protein n=1 Tax=Lipomyces arxii TaxID=56418 RepID=UPI0034CFDC4E